MTSTAIALTGFGCIFSGTLVGLALRRVLPENHLSDESKDAVKLGAGMISTMAALVLGLLVSSAKSNFDSTTAAITQGGAKIILLDRVLMNYGPETKEIREDLRRAVSFMLETLWPEEPLPQSTMKVIERASAMEKMLVKMRELKPESEAQRALLAQAQQLGNEMLLSRWLQIEQAYSSLPMTFLVIVLFWLTMLYTAFGLLAPGNATVITVMCIGALALATAMFLILEMNHPLTGLMKVNSGPIRNAYEHLSR